MFLCIQWHKCKLCFFARNHQQSHLAAHGFVVIFQAIATKYCCDETMNFLQGKLSARTLSGPSPEWTHHGKSWFLPLLWIQPSLWLKKIRIIEILWISVVHEIWWVHDHYTCKQVCYASIRCYRNPLGIEWITRPVTNNDGFSCNMLASKYYPHISMVPDVFFAINL